MKIIKNTIYILIFSLLGWSCSEDFLDPTLSTTKVLEGNIDDINALNTLMYGTYDLMSDPEYYGRDFIVLGEVRTDNAYSNGRSGRFVAPGQFNLLPTSSYSSDTWEKIYQVVANTNLVIGADVQDEETANEIKHVKGQAYAVRALAYYDLLRLYGQQYVDGGTLGVPIITEFNNPENLYPYRNTITEVYDQILKDLDVAKSYMSVDLNESPTVINTYFVPALLSRIYLDLGKYEDAEKAALEVINSKKFELDKNSWVGNESTGSIFQLAYTLTDNNSNASLYFIYQETNYGDIQVLDDLYNLYEDKDVRKGQFKIYADGKRIRTGKYPSKNYADHVMVIRYAEVLLNYAEALTMQGKAGALDALNVIPQKRNATLYTSATIDDVLNERRKELEMEGHRYYDLMRNKRDIVKVDPRQTFSEAVIKYGDARLTFPISLHEMSANSNMEQNKGY